MEKKRYIVWDWNGTLLNDVDLCIDSINQLLEKEELPTLLDKDAYQRVFRFPIIQYYEDAGFDFNKRPFHELADDYMDYYQPRSLSCPLHNGVKETLQHFQDQGFTQVLLSASKLDFLLEQLQGYDILPYFSEVIGLDNIHAYSKADIAKDFAKKHKENTASMVFIGDSVHDYEVAHGAHASCILVANGHEHKDKLLATGSYVVDDIQMITPQLVMK